MAGFGVCSQWPGEVAGNNRPIAQVKTSLFVLFFFFRSPDYPLDLSHNDTFLQATTFLPEDFTYFPNNTCPERLPSMSEWHPAAPLCPSPAPQGSGGLTVASFPVSPPFPARHLGMNGSAVRAQLPPGRSLFTHPQELIPAVSEACLPAEAGAHRLANTNKRGIVCWEPVKRLCQPFSRGRDGGVAPSCLGRAASPSPELCQGCRGRWAGPLQGSWSWEKCFHQSSGGKLGFPGQRFPKGGNALC